MYHPITWRVKADERLFSCQITELFLNATAGHASLRSLPNNTTKGSCEAFARRSTMDIFLAKLSRQAHEIKTLFRKQLLQLSFLSAVSLLAYDVLVWRYACCACTNLDLKRDLHTRVRTEVYRTSGNELHTLVKHLYVFRRGGRLIYKYR
jgi:hypothetical protein